MRSKLDAFKIVMASGIKGFLGQANIPDILLQAVDEAAEGTYFEAEGTLPLNHKEQWLAFNSGPEGEIVMERKRPRCRERKYGAVTAGHRAD